MKEITLNQQEIKALDLAIVMLKDQLRVEKDTANERNMPIAFDLLQQFNQSLTAISNAIWEDVEEIDKESVK